ncbi:MAG: hypothetical protein BM564_01340 [Bacteroidetes bacterium MedPE-SWsnd-G2]|nr:MAG: hypothetical protein BM564_01340 [Bacteroidetes bacterium MedPE-SWsnd-G2]
MYNLKQSYSVKLILWLFVCVLVSTQTTNAQVVMGTPNLGFTQACASASFNSYNTTFVFSGNLEASNQFSIEMSDAEGSFDDSTIIFTSNPGEFTTSPATINFSLPEITSGENYRIRVKSNAPQASSAPSASFAAYYKIQDEPFTINNLVSTGAFCSGGSYVLAIDNPGVGNNNSPLLYPSLSFNWYKETGPTTSVFVSEGNTLTVTEEGTYFVETNYGTCTSNSFSNRVTISEATTGEANVTIASSLGNPYCPAQGFTTLSSIGGLSYTWYKDNIEIEGATQQMYQTDQSGIFTVQVDLGECVAVGIIDLVSEMFESEINVSETNTLEEGETLDIFITSTANSPEYDWYLNDILISNAEGDFFEASEYGDYKVIITETNGCEASKTYEFNIEEAYDPFPDVEQIPNMISPNSDGINDTWMLPIQYVTGSNTEVIIMSNSGKIVHQTTNYENNWPMNNLNPIAINQIFYYIITTTEGKTKKGTITVVK